MFFLLFQFLICFEISKPQFELHCDNNLLKIGPTFPFAIGRLLIEVTGSIQKGFQS